MKKKLENFDARITKMDLKLLKGGGIDPTCGQTTPNTQEPTSYAGRWDSDPDSYCDDD